MQAEDTLDLVQDELATLKTRADRMGISYHPSIGAAKLREKIEEEMKDPEEAEEEAPVVAKKEGTGKETLSQKRARKRREAMELVRIRVTCMNPLKKEWEGEIFTAGNSLVGSTTKYVPFNADDGWHVPRIIYNQMKNRKCQVFTSKRITRGGRNESVREGKLIREFAIEVLPKLTEKELKELGRVQAMRNASDE